ncbi:MAG: hypothetical protein U1D55_18080 [Phycisphaerae bacterium]
MLKNAKRERLVSAIHDWTSLGAYTPRQASSLLHIRPDMAVRWIYGSGNRGSAVAPQYPNHRGELLTFVDLVQAMAIRDMRLAKRLSLQKIRQTFEAAKALGVHFPFAKSHTAYVFHDDIVLRLDNDTLIQVTGKYKLQQLSEPIVYSYLRELSFDDRGLANAFVPVRKKFRSIELNPRVNYGAPTVMPCKYTVATLVSAFDAEGGFDEAADICDVNPLDVKLAVAYENSLSAA